MLVLTHHAREPLVKQGETTFTFVTDGPEAALAQARAAAGDRAVAIGGGASVIRQYLAAAYVDELQLHIVPVLLGAGVRLLEGLAPGRLERLRTIESPSGVVHARYRVAK